MDRYVKCSPAEAAAATVELENIIACTSQIQCEGASAPIVQGILYIGAPVHVDDCGVANVQVKMNLFEKPIVRELTIGSVQSTEFRHGVVGNARRVGVLIVPSR